MEFIKRYGLGVITIALLIVSKIPSHLVRSFIYRDVFRLSVAKHSTIYSRVEFRSPWKICIGKNSIIGHDCMLDGRRSLTIGNNVNVSSGAWIWTLHHDLNDPEFRAVGDEVKIGDRAWICSRATILPGVTVGEGAVVASGAVVVSDVEPYTVVGGIPAKKIADRNRELTYELNYRVPFV